ncbi:hypothetical protein LINPERHAP1_LOCUS30706 [Linum perenne]
MVTQGGDEAQYTTEGSSSSPGPCALTNEELHQLRSLLQCSSPSPQHRALSVSKGLPALPNHSGPYYQQDDWFGHRD